MRFLFYSGFFDPGTTFAITTATSGTVPIVDSIPPRAHLMTVLFPAPDETPTMLQLSVAADCRLDSLQLPIRRGMELVFPRLTHAAVIQERHSTGASSSSRGGGSMSLLQLQATVIRHATKAPVSGCVAPLPVREGEPLTPAAVQAKADGGSAGACVVPTPFGRRHLPPVRLPAPAETEESDHAARNASSCLPASDPPARLVLHDLLPEPATGLGFGLTPDMLDFLLHEHVLSEMPQHLPPLPDLESCSAAGWGCLPAWDRASHLQALYLFTDGSFFPGSTCAGWAVVALGLCQNRVVRLGFCHGTCGGTSAYDGELRALAHARAIALAARPVSTVVASDCLSALQVAFGQASFSHSDGAARALAGLALASTAFGQAVAPLHVRSHIGCAYNGLADALAKGAARFLTPDPFLGTVFWTGVAEKVCDWVWLLAPRYAASCQLPALSESGVWNKATCEVAPSTVAEACLFQPAPASTRQPAKTSFRVVQYNCLSLRGAPAQALMVAGLKTCRVQVATFQETRLSQSGIGFNDAFWVLSSPCLPNGAGGCQLWLHKQADVIVGPGGAWGWIRKSFTIVHASAQLLVATAAAGPFQFCFVSGHAPFATAPEDRRKEWWALLTSQLRRIPRGHILVLGLDANARFRHVPGERQSAVSSPPVCCNALALGAVVEEFELASNAPTSITGKTLRTWTSPAGKDGAIDYLLVSSAWASAISTEDTPDLQDQHQGFDHWPLAVTLCASMAGDFSPKSPTFSRRALDTEEGRAVAAEAIATLPCTCRLGCRCHYACGFAAPSRPGYPGTSIASRANASSTSGRHCGYLGLGSAAPPPTAHSTMCLTRGASCPAPGFVSGLARGTSQRGDMSRIQACGEPTV